MIDVRLAGSILIFAGPFVSHDSLKGLLINDVTQVVLRSEYLYLTYVTENLLMKHILLIVWKSTQSSVQVFFKSFFFHLMNKLKIGAIKVE